MLGPFEEEAAAEPADAATLPAGPKVPGPAGPQQAAAGARQRAQQEEGGIADLQELLDLHRSYIRGASADCLTFGGNPAAREGVDAALQAAIDFSLRLQAAVRLGAAGRGEAAWVQVRAQAPRAGNGAGLVCKAASGLGEDIEASLWAQV